MKFVQLRTIQQEQRKKIKSRRIYIYLRRTIFRGIVLEVEPIYKLFSIYIDINSERFYFFCLDLTALIRQPHAGKFIHSQTNHIIIICMYRV